MFKILKDRIGDMRKKQDIIKTSGFEKLLTIIIKKNLLSGLNRILDSVEREQSGI